MRLQSLLLSIAAPPASSNTRGKAPKQGLRPAPPRHRLFGGDIPRGGTPPALGHAGRSTSLPILHLFHLSSHVPILISLVGAIVCLGLFPSPAFAAVTITFTNGGTATLNANGTISGSAWVGDWDDPLGTHFPITMPDGTNTYGWCQDTGHYAPSPGNHPFVATPIGGGSYSVLITTSDSPASPHQVEGYFFIDPPQRVGGFTWSPRLMGKLKISKSSALPNITNNNANYSLNNARYTIYKNSACTEQAGELTTDANGKSGELELAPGTYWIKESDAPTGYCTDNNAHEVTVRAGETTTGSLNDTPMYEKPDVWALKQDIEYEAAQGSASLAGAEFTVCYYDGTYDNQSLPADATRTWVLRSDEQGRIVPSSENLVRGSSFYYNEADEVVIPLGTVTVQETKAPSGYWLEGQTPDSPPNYEAPVHITTVNGSGSYGIVVAQELVRRAGVLVHKVDVQTGVQAQGDATFEGIEFSIINRNEQAVVVDGAVYIPGEIVGSIYTDNKGTAQTSTDYLPLGTYEVTETDTNDSMLLTAESQTITLKVPHTNQVVSLSNPMSNYVVRGGVKVGKVSRETGRHLTQGEAVLSGAVFSITLESPQPVLVNGSMFNTGEVVHTLVTDKDGFASTDDHALPYGTYTIREEEPPVGFLNNDEWSQTIQVREEGVIVDISDEEQSVDDQVIRGGFSFNKADESSMERMGGVAWLITSVTTGEKHVMVSDENGIVDTESNPHSSETNQNDHALQDGVVVASDLNSHAGVWFSGRTDLQTKPNNELCALPYDVYTVDELRCPANEGNDLVSFTVRIHEHDAHINMGTVDDKRTEVPLIGTSLTYGGSDHVAPESQDVTLVDTVSYQGLKANEEYTMEGELRYRDTGEQVVDAGGQPVEGSVSFVPTTSIGSVQVTFELDSSMLVDNSVVAFERVLHNAEQIAEHADLDDEGQTVRFPKVGTTLADVEGNKEVRADERIKLVDTVAYTNLVPSIRYEVEGTLMDKDTGKALEDGTGSQIHASTSFIPTESDGTVDVSFVFEGSLAEGRTLVAFESLKRAGIELVSHQDLDDVEQTVHVPSLHTNLADEQGQQTINVTETVKLVDTITYTGLEPGATYTVIGTLVNKESGEPLKQESGEEVQASTTFVPTEPSGTTTVTFVVSPTLVHGTQVVAYESLRHDDREVAIHANINDTAQTASFPSLHTTLVGSQGTHEIEQDNVILTDTVEYEGLCPHVPYTITGTLMDKTTGQPLEETDGVSHISSTTFTPEEPTGSVQVTFAVDTRELGGHTLVAFESLREGTTQDGKEIATHADLDAIEQTVVVPQLFTTASNAQDSSKKLDEKGTARIKDTVRYEGLTPSKTYVVEGVLYNKDTGKELLDTDGNVISSTSTFVPEASSGSVDVDFEFDASRVTGSGLVVFETCLCEGRVIATHENLSDEDQTVLVEHSKNAKHNEESQRSGSSKSKTPGTGDYGQMIFVALALALLGVGTLVIRKWMR